MAAGSVQIAQQIAEIPVLSGSGLRFIVTSIVTVVTIIYVLRYCRKIRLDNSKSILYGTEYAGFGELDVYKRQTISTPPRIWPRISAVRSRT